MANNRRQRMVAFSDGDLHKRINIIAKELEVPAQEVVRKGIEAYLEKIEKDRVEFIKRTAKR